MSDHGPEQPRPNPEQAAAVVPDFAAFYESINRGNATELDLALALGGLLQSSVSTSPQAREFAQTCITMWSEKYAFDVTSTRFGDRNTTVIEESQDGEEEAFLDPDGSGNRSAGDKRANLIAEVTSFLATSTYSRLSEEQKTAMLQVAVMRMAALNRRGRNHAAGMMQERIRDHCDWHAITGEEAALLDTLRVAELAGVVDSHLIQTYLGRPSTLS